MLVRYMEVLLTEHGIWNFDKIRHCANRGSSWLLDIP